MTSIVSTHLYSRPDDVYNVDEVLAREGFDVSTKVFSRQDYLDLHQVRDVVSEVQRRAEEGVS